MQITICHFIVHTDASSLGLGAVLYQRQEGKERVIAYASRGLKPSERNFPAHRLEFLALKWAVTHKFHDYLYGNSFEVVTDNNPLTYILSKAKLDATSHRWVSALALYDFTISYRKGSLNSDGDGLSRRPQLFSDAVKAICLAAVSAVPLAYSVSDHIDPTKDSMPENLHNIDWREEQRQDQTLGRVIELVESSFQPRGEESSREPVEVQKFMREWKRLHLEDDILYRTAFLDGEEVRQLVVPEHFKDIALIGVHDDVGHQGKDKTLWLARQRFYWPGLEKSVIEKVEGCGRCIRRKTPVRPTAELVPIVTTRPLELLCIDFLGLEKSKGGQEHILVITDHFTRYAQAVPCRNQLATTTAKALYENFIVHYSFPERIHSDQGKNFESRLIKELCKLAGVKKTRTTPYHPMGNGSAERFNLTLLRILGTLDEDKKSDWKTYVAPLVQAYNATKNESTGFSPHYLMFGWHPRLSVDAFLGIEPGNTGKSDHQTYARKLRERLQYAYRVASEKSEKSGSKNKEMYDRKVKESKLEIGDRILVRKVGLVGRQKLADKWEQEPYLVTQIPNNEIPVYKVKREDGKGTTRTLHRNMLLPFNVLPTTESHSSQNTETQRSQPQTRAKKPVQKQITQSETSSSEDSDSSGSSYVPRYIVPQRRRRELSPLQSNSTLRELSPSVVDHSAHSEQSHHTTVHSPDTGHTQSIPQVSSSNPLETSHQSQDRDQSPVRRSKRDRRPPDRYGQWNYNPVIIRYETWV